ncbi:MAG: tetratricopeptide repeat protein, partial [Epsilonproteobacteria bacterium]|nr:tetratricopeptide repeat protein [Campylobacterota bacterium]
MNKKLFYYFLFSPILFADILPFQTIEKANDAYEKGEYHKSAELFNELKKDDPTVAYNEANAHYKAGDYDKALKHYEKAKGIDEATRQHNLGNTHFKKDDLENAIKSYEESLKIRDDEDTRYNLESLPVQKRLVLWDLVKSENEGDILIEVSDSVRQTLIA